MRSHLYATLLVVLLLSPAPAQAQPDSAWTGAATLIGGTARYDRGEWIHTDYVYDDYGADTGPAWGQPNVVSLASTAGDARYPEGLENAADRR